MLPWHGTQLRTALVCFWSGNIKQTFIGTRGGKLCLSALKGSYLYKTFGLSVIEIFLIKASREPVSLSFTLSLLGQQSMVFTIVLCQWQRPRWASLIGACFYFFTTDTAAQGQKAMRGFHFFRPVQRALQSPAHLFGYWKQRPHNSR